MEGDFRRLRVSYRTHVNPLRLCALSEAGVRKPDSESIPIPIAIPIAILVEACPGPYQPPPLPSLFPPLCPLCLCG